MTSDNMRKWFFLNRYIVPSEFETKMEELAAEGWQVDSFGMMSSLCVTFHKTAPKKYKYTLDFSFFGDKGIRMERIQQGWEYLGRTSNCFIWRKSYSGEKPASFLGKAGERARDSKLFYVLLLPFMLMAVLLFSAMTAAANHSEAISMSDMLVVACVSLAGMLYTGWALLKLRTGMKKQQD